jgi:hypothetical protein
VQYSLVLLEEKRHDEESKLFDYDLWEFFGVGGCLESGDPIDPYSEAEMSR